MEVDLKTRELMKWLATIGKKETFASYFARVGKIMCQGTVGADKEKIASPELLPAVQFVRICAGYNNLCNGENKAQKIDVFFHLAKQCGWNGGYLPTEWKKNLFESIKEISIDKQAQVSEDEGGAEVFGEFDSSVDLSHLSDISQCHNITLKWRPTQFCMICFCGLSSEDSEKFVDICLCDHDADGVYCAFAAHKTCIKPSSRIGELFYCDEHLSLYKKPIAPPVANDPKTDIAIPKTTVPMKIIPTPALSQVLNTGVRKKNRKTTLTREQREQLEKANRAVSPNFTNIGNRKLSLPGADLPKSNISRVSKDPSTLLTKGGVLVYVVSPERKGIMRMIDAHLTFNCLCGCQKTYERMEFYQHQIQYGKKLSKEKILDHIFTSSDNQSLREFLNIPGGMSDEENFEDSDDSDSDSPALAPSSSSSSPTSTLAPPSSTLPTKNPVAQPAQVNASIGAKENLPNKGNNVQCSSNAMNLNSSDKKPCLIASPNTDSAKIKDNVARKGFNDVNGHTADENTGKINTTVSSNGKDKIVDNANGNGIQKGQNVEGNDNSNGSGNGAKKIDTIKGTGSNKGMTNSIDNNNMAISNTQNNRIVKVNSLIKNTQRPNGTPESNRLNGGGKINKSSAKDISKTNSNANNKANGNGRSSSFNVQNNINDNGNNSKFNSNVNAISPSQMNGNGMMTNANLSNTTSPNYGYNSTNVQPNNSYISNNYVAGTVDSYSVTDDQGQNFIMMTPELAMQNMAEQHRVELHRLTQHQSEGEVSSSEKFLQQHLNIQRNNPTKYFHMLTKHLADLKKKHVTNYKEVEKRQQQERYYLAQHLQQLSENNIVSENGNVSGPNYNSNSNNGTVNSNNGTINSNINNNVSNENINNNVSNNNTNGSMNNTNNMNNTVVNAKGNNINNNNINNNNINSNNINGSNVIINTTNNTMKNSKANTYNSYMNDPSSNFNNYYSTVQENMDDDVIFIPNNNINNNNNNNSINNNNNNSNTIINNTNNNNIGTNHNSMGMNSGHNNTSPTASVSTMSTTTATVTKNNLKNLKKADVTSKSSTNNNKRKTSSTQFDAPVGDSIYQPKRPLVSSEKVGASNEIVKVSSPGNEALSSLEPQQIVTQLSAIGQWISLKENKVKQMEITVEQLEDKVEKLENAVFELEGANEVCKQEVEYWKQRAMNAVNACRRNGIDLK